MNDKKQTKDNLKLLKERAKKRSISFSSNPKPAENVQIENDFFKVIEPQIYNQIARN